VRRGEALGFHWTDINMDAKTVTININLQRINGILQLVAPKTKESRRTLALRAPLVRALRQHQVRQQQERLQAGSRWREHGLVFVTTAGTLIAPRNMLRSFHALLAHARLPKMRYHDLRHSSATILQESGESLDVVHHLLAKLYPSDSITQCFSTVLQHVLLEFLHVECCTG
jgi:integrase